MKRPKKPQKTFQINDARPAYLRGAVQTQFNEDEAWDFDAYLAFHLEDTEIEFTPGVYRFQQMITATREFRIGSPQFNETKLFCVPDVVIARLERGAGLPPLGAHQLSFGGLLARVLEKQESTAGTRRKADNGTKPRGSKVEADGFIQKVLAGGNAELIREWVFATKDDLANLCACSRGTAMKTVFWTENRASAQAKWMREHGGKKPARRAST